jgi:hypothetical protein
MQVHLIMSMDPGCYAALLGLHGYDLGGHCGLFKGPMQWA